MNHTMNDFEELHERAEDENKLTRCSNCNESYHRDMVHLCRTEMATAPAAAGPTWDEVAEAAQRALATARADALPIITAQQRPVSRGRVVDQRRPGMDEEIAQATRATFERQIRAIAREVRPDFYMTCVGCGEPNPVGSSCPCGYTDYRDRDLSGVAQTADPRPSLLDYAGTVTGRMSSSQPNVSNLPRSLPDEENLSQYIVNGGRGRRRYYVRENHHADCECAACRYERLGREETPVVSQERCSICHNTRVVAINHDNGPVCPSCVSAGRHRPTQTVNPTAYIYRVVCSHCRAATTFGTLALANRSISDQNRTCSACGHYALSVEERRANDPRINPDLEQARMIRNTQTTYSREQRAARIPTPDRPTYTSADPPEDPEERRRRIRRGQLESQIRMAEATQRDADAARRELDTMDQEDTPIERFVPKRKVDLE